MKKYMLLLAFTLMLCACTQSEEEKIQVYLKDKSKNFYDFSVVDFADGELNIEVKMLPNSETWSNYDAELDVGVESKPSLEAVNYYSKEHLGVVKQANIFFVTRESNKTVEEINANNDTIVETSWLEVTNQEFPRIVDGYKFYGVSD